MSIFYDNFVRLCAVNNMSESGAAQAIGLSNAAATGWKNGKIPSRTTRVKLATLFNVTVEELMGEGIKKEPAENGKLSYAQLELIELSSKMSDDELRKFIAAMKAMIGD